MNQVWIKIELREADGTPIAEERIQKSNETDAQFLARLAVCYEFMMHRHGGS